MSRKIEKASHRLAELEAQIKPGEVVYTWRRRGDGKLTNMSSGEVIKEEDLPRGENVLNIIITPV